MLAEFSVKNYGPFKEEAVLSMAPWHHDRKKPETLLLSNVRRPKHLLKTAIIYGANLTGKSILLEALSLLIDSSLDKEIAWSSYPVCRDRQPTLLEMVVILDSVPLLYQVEITPFPRSCKPCKVVKRLSVGDQTLSDKGWKLIGHKENDKILLDKPLSPSKQHVGENKWMVGVNWFVVNRKTQSGILTMEETDWKNDKKRRKNLVTLCQKADLPIPKDFVSYCENSGLFGFLETVDHGLKEGINLVVDDLDLGLHPILTRYLLHLYNSEETNPHGTQLVCSVHDASLLMPLPGPHVPVRRDQVWFVDIPLPKPRDATLISLHDFKKDKWDKKHPWKYVAQDYLTGAFGVIPFVDIDSM